MGRPAAGQRGSGAVRQDEEYWSECAPSHHELAKGFADLAPCPTARLPRWYLWTDETPRPGYANMAIDTALLERADRLGESWLRLYQWEPYCLSFGRHEPATRRYDVAQIKRLGLDTVRRPTGGRAVWHARELTYAVAAPSARFGSLRDAYLEIHRMIAEGLGRLGARVSVAPAVRPPSLGAGACFARPAGGELMMGGRKIVGSAQYRQGTALLQHGSILLEDDQQMVLAVTRGATPLPRVASLGEALDRSIGPLELGQAIARVATRRWTGSWTPATPETIVAEGLPLYPHYRSAAWTWMR